MIYVILIAGSIIGLVVAWMILTGKGDNRTTP